MKILQLLLLIAFFPAVCMAQGNAALKSTIKAEAEKMGKALMAKDFNTFIKTTHPLVIENTEGGKEALMDQIKEEVSLMEQEGTRILNLWPGEPSDIIDTAKELQCTIPQYMELKVQGGKMKTANRLIALSKDKGKTWYFIDAAGHELEDIKEMFPTLSSKLDITEAEEPVFTADN